MTPYLLGLLCVLALFLWADMRERLARIEMRLRENSQLLASTLAKAEHAYELLRNEGVFP